MGPSTCRVQSSSSWSGSMYEGRVDSHAVKGGFSSWNHAQKAKLPIHASAAMMASCGPLTNWIHPNSVDLLQATVVASVRKGR
jgi:hypothetical protein